MKVGRHWVWLLPLLAVAAVFALRLAGPPDVRDKDQARPIDYVLDAAADGHWLVQRDAGGDIASKPPVYTWLASASSLAFGGNRFAIYLPCALAMAMVALLAVLQARRRLGWAAGLAAGMAVALALDTQKAVTLARTDAVFAACTGVAAWLALRSWESGRGWILFWLVCAVVSLAKSPVGVVFAAGGLFAACWRSERPALAERNSGWQHAVGVPLLLIIGAGWLLAAVETLGLPVIDKLIGKELVGHATANDNDTPWLQTFWRPPLWHLGLFAPWSLLTCMALWRLAQHPPASPRRRRFLRFMACWLGFGLLVLCLAPHKRMVLSLPMLLPGAVLAGAEAGRWLGRLGRGRQVMLWAALAVMILAGLAIYHLNRDPRKDRIDESRAVIATGEGLGRLAAQGIAVTSAADLPSTIRYFTPGWPPQAGSPAQFLAASGPGAVAVATGTVVPGAVQRLPLADGIEVAIDAEAAKLLP
jgi:4-amino-4-deoxy-L-arabinose transferase-like glycosyltransferase